METHNSGDLHNATDSDESLRVQEEVPANNPVKQRRWRHPLFQILWSIIGFLLVVALEYILLARYMAGPSVFLMVFGAMLFIVVVRWCLMRFYSAGGSTTKDGEEASPRETDQGRIVSEERVEQELDPFELLVQQVIESIPDEFRKKMDNLVIFVEDEPDAETLERLGVGKGQILLGLYQGVPLTAYGQHYALLPERITIYQRPIERYCHNDPERIRAQVRKTVLHEIAHHFGMGHEEMPIWVQ